MPNTVYRDAILADNPLFYWPLSETTGSTAGNLGSVGSAGNGTFGASTTKNSLTLAYDSAYKAPNFNGTNQHIEFPVGMIGSYLHGATALTIELLVRMTNTGINRAPIFQVWNDGADFFSNCGFYFEAGYTSQTGPFAFNGGPEAGGNTTASGGGAINVQTNQTKHLVGVMTYGAGAARTVSLYINGALVQQQINSGIGASFVLGTPTQKDYIALWGASTLRNGATLASLGYASLLQGYVGDVAIYNTAFTAGQVRSRYLRAIATAMQAKHKLARPKRSMQIPIHMKGL